METAAAPRPDLPPGGRAWDETLALEAADGVALRGALWRAREERAPRGLVLLLQGRTEFLEKYGAPAAELVGRGFAVASVDWRGQGRSDRLTRNPLKGHVRRFTDYHLDLAALIAHPSVAAVPGPRVMLAHSMGGAIGLGAILRGRVRPAAAVLSAPMLGIAMSPVQRLLAGALEPLAGALGLGERWPPLPGRAQPYVFSGFEGNVLTDDRATFEWMVETLRRDPALRIGMPTLGWFAATTAEARWLAGQGAEGASGLPGLCLLGSKEAVVDAEAVRAAARRLGFGLAEIAGGRHELLIAAAPRRAEAWAAIDRFLGERGLGERGL